MATDPFAEALADIDRDFGTDLPTAATDVSISPPDPSDPFASALSDIDRDFGEQQIKPLDEPQEPTGDGGFITAVETSFLQLRRNWNLLQGDVDELAEISRQLDEGRYRPSEAMQRFQAAEGVDALGIIASNPFKIVAEIMGQAAASSLPSLAGGIVGGVTAGLPGGAIGVGLGSGVMEGTSKFLESLQESGVNLRDAEDIRRALDDPAIVAKARSKAFRKGLTVLAFDTATAIITGGTLAGFGGRLGSVARSLAGPEVSVGRRLATASLIEAAGGAGGEAAGQIVAGDEVRLQDVLAEGIGELVFGVGEAGTTLAGGGTRAAIRAQRRRGLAAQEESDVEAARDVGVPPTVEPQGPGAVPVGEVIPGAEEVLAQAKEMGRPTAIPERAFIPVDEPPIIVGQFEDIRPTREVREARAARLREEQIAPETKPSFEYEIGSVSDEAFQTETQRIADEANAPLSDRQNAFLIRLKRAFDRFAQAGDTANLQAAIDSGNARMTGLSIPQSVARETQRYSDTAIEQLTDPAAEVGPPPGPSGISPETDAAVTPPEAEPSPEPIPTEQEVIADAAQEDEAPTEAEAPASEDEVLAAEPEPVLAPDEFGAPAQRDKDPITTNKEQGDVQQSVVADTTPDAAFDEDLDWQNNAIGLEFDRAAPGPDAPPSTSTPATLQSVADIARSLGLNAVIRVGGFNFQIAKLAEVTRGREGVVRLQNAADIPNATHAIGHLVQKQLFGDISQSSIYKFVPESAIREMKKLGVARYGSRKPNGGYEVEGFAEYFRHLVTRDDAAQIAPETHRFFKEFVLDKNADFRAAVEKAQETVTNYRKQPATTAAAANLYTPSKVRRIWDSTKAALAPLALKRDWVDEFAFMEEPAKALRDQKLAEFHRLKKLGRDDEAKTLFDEFLRRVGNRVDLRADFDVYKVAQHLRMSAPAIVFRMVENSQETPRGKILGTGLHDILVPFRNQEEDFKLFLWSMRARELWTPTEKHPDGRDPGMRKEDADQIYNQFRNKTGDGGVTFEEAARQVDQWNRNILEFVRETLRPLGASATPMIEQLDRIEAASDFYVPLSRQIDSTDKGAVADYLNEVKRSSGGRGGGDGNFYHLNGSGRGIIDPINASITNAVRYISQAQKTYLTGLLLRYHDTPAQGGFGLDNVGQWVRTFDPGMVPQQARIETLKTQLEEAGVDLQDADMTAVLSFWSAPTVSADGNPVVSWPKPDGGVSYFELDKNLYSALSGVDSVRLPWYLDIVFGIPARTFRLGTTGLRATFSFFTNPVRDLPTWLLQTKSDKRLPEMLSYWASANRAALLRRSDDPYFGLFERLHGDIGQPLGFDIYTTRRAVDFVFEPKGINVLKHPIDALRTVFSAPEAATRTAELRAVAEGMGLKLDKDGRFPVLTDEQLVGLSIATKQSTVDFAAMGRYGKLVNQMVPFFNAAIQGSRVFARTIQEKHEAGGTLWKQMVLRGGALTAMTVMLWMTNRDEDWYKDADPRTKYLYWLFKVPGTEQIVGIPRPFEWGNFFSVIPEALLDAMYQEDPQAVIDMVDHIVETTSPLETLNPMRWPVLGRAILEQAGNRIEFFDRPIVPEAELNLPPEEQKGPFTSNVAVAIAENLPDFFPDEWRSPRRIDAAVRSVFGGAAHDLTRWPDRVQAIGQLTDIIEGDGDPSQVLPFLRSGGAASLGSRATSTMYDDRRRLTALSRSREKDLTEEQESYLKSLNLAVSRVSALSALKRNATTVERRTEFDNSIRELAMKVTLDRPDIDYSELADRPAIDNLERDAERSLRNARSVIRGAAVDRLKERFPDMSAERLDQIANRNPRLRNLDRFRTMINRGVRAGNEELLQRTLDALTTIIEEQGVVAP